ncbi:hypothetical protein F5884DRAFT_693599 [Xylogone sp. PMI_703]|nr:hypothetical protein F5884DRAFT_693599 [Xylogone sp. PMI_703]
MSVEVVLESPLAHALHAAIQPKLVEVGWSGTADESALSEYIILMLANGKTQDQVAAELSGDLLNLPLDDPGARDFSQWLFEQVEILSAQLNGGGPGSASEPANNAAQPTAMATGQDAEMGDASEAGNNVPTGPKSMRNMGNRSRDKRMLGQMAKAMDRSQDPLHRVRPQAGHERINTHGRGPPTGPRGQAQGRGGPRMQNGRPSGAMGGMQMQSGAAGNVMNMTPQQQFELLAMLEQQSRMMAQMFTPQQQQMMLGGGGKGGFQQQQGKSLFDRVQNNPHRQQNNGFRKNPKPTGAAEDQMETQSSSMDIEMGGSEKAEGASPDTPCKYNLSCTNKDCKFAHQSPAAPPGTAIDVNDVCSFGAACKNRKCTGRHPSPAQKIAHQTEQDCKFFPNCTNPRCPFRHPSMPLCRNGADCTTPNCKFTHVTTPCKFNPCLNPTCPFKHQEGQKRGKFDDKVWVADGSKEHVSERKFVDETAGEELIRPQEEGAPDSGMGQVTNNTEVIT